jgi:DNA-binding transcriptional LysR family regulator
MDLNLLPVLDALLSECSVTAAARRLNLSPSAMSRALTRLRTLTGDPLLVRAGRGLVLTPHAAQLRSQVPGLARQIEDLLKPARQSLDLTQLDRTFTLRANEGFIDVFGGPLASALASQAPRARVRFVLKADKDARHLREGLADLEIGVMGQAGPEFRVQALYHDRFVGVVRAGHPLLDGPVTPERYVAFGHVVTSRRGRPQGPVDEALAALGLQRDIRVVVPGFPAALAIARASDLIALAPLSFLRGGTATAAQGASAFHAFDLPVSTPGIAISQLWHPRLDADPAHRWLRALTREICREEHVRHD